MLSTLQVFSTHLLYPFSPLSNFFPQAKVFFTKFLPVELPPFHVVQRPGSEVRTCDPQLASSVVIQSTMEDAGKGQREFLSVSEGAVSAVKAHVLRLVEPSPFVLELEC